MTFNIIHGTSAGNRERIKSRVRLKDGTVLDGSRGREVISERLEYQQKIDRLQKKYSPQELNEMAKRGHLPRYEGR